MWLIKSIKIISAKSGRVGTSMPLRPHSESISSCSILSSSSLRRRAESAFKIVFHEVWPHNICKITILCVPNTSLSIFQRAVPSSPPGRWKVRWWWSCILPWSCSSFPVWLSSRWLRRYRESRISCCPLRPRRLLPNGCSGQVQGFLRGSCRALFACHLWRHERFWVCSTWTWMKSWQGAAGPKTNFSVEESCRSQSSPLSLQTSSPSQLQSPSKIYRNFRT